MKRGLYQTAFGWLINADCNAAFNMMGKVATQLGLNLTEVGRVALTLLKRYDLFNDLKQSYRFRGEARLAACFVASA